MDDRPPQERDRVHRRSFFWPLVLVGVGIIWLLSNLGILSSGSLWSLVRFWPLLLIAIGLDLIFGRRRPWVGALIGVLTLVLVILLLIAMPGLRTPVSGRPELTTTHLTEPIDGAASAIIKLDLAEAPTTVRGLADSTDLINATLIHRGQVGMNVSGEQEKVVTLQQSNSLGFPMIGLFAGGERWDIALTPDIPLQMEIKGGAGSAQLDLDPLQITSLNLDVTSGRVRAMLPATEGRCRVLVEGGSGSLDLTLAEKSQVDMELNAHSGSTDLVIGQGTSLNAQVDGGSGKLLIDIPDSAALRFTVSAGGSGSVTLPSELQQVSDGGDSDKKTGTWETPGFAKAGSGITISVDVGSGSVVVR